MRRFGKSMVASKESLTIGIVTHNSADRIERTVLSVLDCLPADRTARLYVLDNRSTDDTIAIIREIARADDRVTLILGERNSGFAVAHNAILAEVSSEYHIICNPDITMTEGSIESLLGFLDDNPSAAIACPHVRYEDGRIQHLNRRHPTVLDLVLRRFVPGAVQSLFRERMERYEMIDVGYDHSYPVPFVSGALMACRTAALKEVGGFDERYFLYFEDVDLSRSVQAQGWQTLYCPDAVVFHDWRRESRKSLKGTVIISCSAIRYFNKWGWVFY